MPDPNAIERKVDDLAEQVHALRADVHSISASLATTVSLLEHTKVTAQMERRQDALDTRIEYLSASFDGLRGFTHRIAWGTASALAMALLSILVLLLTKRLGLG